MEIGQGYQKSELLQVTEQIYEFNSKKQQLELQLSGEEFHQKYIPRRENMIRARIKWNLPILIVLFVMTVISIVVWALFLWNYNGGGASGLDGLALLITGLILIFSIKYLYKMGKEESQMVIRFFYSNNPDKAMHFAEKYNINTFQDDRLRTESKIDELKERILVYENKIHNLEIRQQEILDQKKTQEEVLKKHEVIREEEKDNANSGSLSLKKTDNLTMDIREIDEYYTREQNLILMNLKDLKFNLTAVEKEMNNIDAEMLMVKNKITIFIIAFIVAAVVQTFIPGFIGGIYGIVCLIVSCTVFFSLERYCRGPIIRYLVEKESELVTEYCFINDVVPLKQKRAELQTLIEKEEKAFEENKRRKKEMEERIENLE